METLILAPAPTSEEAAVGNPKDIRFRKKGGVITIRIKVGPDWLDRSGGWRTIKEAMAPAIALRDKLQAEYALAHPELAVEEAEASAEARKPREGEKSLRERAEEEHEKYVKRQRLRDGVNGTAALKWLWGQLGEKADLPPRLQKLQSFTKVRNAFFDGPLAQRTMELYSKHIREILRRVSDLDAQCIEELENLPRKDGATIESGDAFQRHHFQEMFKRIGSADETTQLIFWIGASGGPQIVDTVFLPFRAVDWTTGMLRYSRVKTGERVEFRALPPLVDLLKKRREKLGPDAVYVLPEIIFLKKDQKNLACNTKDWEGFKNWDKAKVPKAAAVRGGMYGTLKMTAFLKQCGIKTEDLTHKSFRKHCISFWASIGIKLKTRMRMAGHSKETSHHRYDVAAEFEIIQASEITWQYYQAIMKGEDFFIPTTTYDIYKVLMAQWSKLPELLQALVREHFDGLQGFLEGAFAGQKTLIEEQTRTLQGENAKLREQLAAIQDSCGKLAKHFGLV